MEVKAIRGAKGGDRCTPYDRTVGQQIEANRFAARHRRKQTTSSVVGASQHCAGLPSAGKVMRLHLSHYPAIVRAADQAQTMTSLQVAGDANTAMFRAIMPIDGPSKIEDPLTAKSGASGPGFSA